MKKIKVITITVLVLIPVTLFCMIEFSKEEQKARRVRYNAHLIKPGMSRRQIIDILDSPDIDTYFDKFYFEGKALSPHSEGDTILWRYHWGFGSSSDMEIALKNDSAISVYPGE